VIALPEEPSTSGDQPVGGSFTTVCAPKYTVCPQHQEMDFLTLGTYFVALSSRTEAHRWACRMARSSLQVVGR
jgi:hypothetical protein